MSVSNPGLARFGNVSVRLAVELGRTELPLKTVLSLAEGSVVTLDRLTDELLDVTANGRVVAQGEVVAQDGRFALRIVSLVGDDAAPEMARADTAPGEMIPAAAPVVSPSVGDTLAQAVPAPPPPSPQSQPAPAAEPAFSSQDATA